MKWNYRKIGIYAGVLVCVIGMFVIGRSRGQASDGTTASVDYTMRINQIEDEGSYTGQMQNGIPHGKGHFETSPDASRQYCYDGGFKNGRFSGKGVMTFGDGSCLEIKYKDGVANGSGILTYPDGSYAEVEYDQGTQVRLSVHYDEDGTFLDTDYYYDGESVKELVEVARKADYRAFYQDWQGLYGDVFCVEGTVSAVYETEKSCILKITDADDNVYIASYYNTASREYNQAIVPALQVGDALTAYGFFSGMEPFEDEETAEDVYSYPHLALFYAGGASAVTVDRTAPSTDYADVCAAPYAYYGIEDTLAGTVENVAVGNRKRCYVRFLSEDGDTYYFLYKYGEDGYVPAPGDAITVTVRYNGLYKEYDETQGVCRGIYPYAVVQGEVQRMTEGD